MQLEEMAAFFAARVEGYDQHMFANIDGAPEFYPATAALLRECHCILDLGCGTGLEIGEIFIQNPTARITGIDLSPAMLAALSEKFAARKTQLTLLQGDYFSLPFGEAQFDGAVSVESLHHFTHEEKLGLYQKLFAALTPGGLYVETDYMAPIQAYEDFYFAEARRLRAAQGMESGFVHYDTPCTLENQTALLRRAGFATVECRGRWENTYLLLARKEL